MVRSLFVLDPLQHKESPPVAGRCGELSWPAGSGAVVQTDAQLVARQAVDACRALHSLGGAIDGSQVHGLRVRGLIEFKGGAPVVGEEGYCVASDADLEPREFVLSGRSSIHFGSDGAPEALEVVLVHRFSLL